jgi:protein-disulfide isomerase
MSSILRPLACGAAVLLLAFSVGQPASAQAISPAQRTEIEKIIHDYLMKNPQVLEDAYTELQKRKQHAMVDAHAQVLFHSSHQVALGNPKGDVTMVEFFDYNCPHCKDALADMLNLMKTDPKLRVVLKEFPVLGPQSVEAARVAVAVRMQDPTGKKYLEFHRKMFEHRGINDKTQALATAKEIGLDMTRLEKDLASPEVDTTLRESFQLAEALGLDGTPSYVIGYGSLIGQVGAKALREQINETRCGKSTC